MLDLKTIRRLILASCPNSKTELVSAEKAVGRVLAQDILASRNIPEYEVSACDGLAVQWDAMKKGFFDFSANQLATPGINQLKIESIDEAVEIKKGALLPQNSDTIIPQSGFTIEGEGFFRSAHVLGTQHVKGQNVLKQGQLCTEGKTLIKAHTKLSPTHLAAISLSNMQQISVFRKPKIALITDTFMKENTGFHSSAYVPVFMELIRGFGADIEIFPSQLSNEIPSKWLKRVCSMSDGVVLLRTSERKNIDSVTSTLIETGIKSFADGAKIKACDRFWFGLYENNIPFWDISSGFYEQLLQTTIFIKPWMDKLLGLQHIETHAYVSELAEISLGFDFLPAKLVPWDGKVMAQFVGFNDFEIFNEQATGFVDLRNRSGEGNLYPFISFL